LTSSQYRIGGLIARELILLPKAGHDTSVLRYHRERISAAMYDRKQE
jgi:hypothetical protein